MESASIQRKINLGKLLKVGETFITTTKWMHKKRHGQTRWNKELNGQLITYEVLRAGSHKSFEKGKRKYVCMVIELVETRCKKQGLCRCWQFSYLVKIIEN